MRRTAAGQADSCSVFSVVQVDGSDLSCLPSDEAPLPVSLSMRGRRGGAEGYFAKWESEKMWFITLAGAL